MEEAAYKKIKEMLPDIELDLTERLMELVTAARIMKRKIKEVKDEFETINKRAKSE